MISNGQAYGRWTDGAPMLSACFEAAVAAVAGEIYVVGGYPRETALQIYDPVADHWRLGPPLPESRHHAVAGNMNGKLVVVGGYADERWVPVDSIYEHDPSTDRWRPCAAMSEPRGALGGAVLEGKLHAVGGVGGYDGTQDVGTHEVYDPSTDPPLALRASMPRPRDHLAVAAIDGQLYAIGGRTQNKPAFNVADNTAYTLSTDTWQTRALMPRARSGIAAATLGGKIYVFGGEGPNDAVFGQVEAYDPQTDRWSPCAPMRTPRHGLGAIALDGRIYVIGGASGPGSAQTSALNEIFVP